MIDRSIIVCKSLLISLSFSFSFNFFFLFHFFFLVKKRKRRKGEGEKERNKVWSWSDRLGWLTGSVRYIHREGRVEKEDFARKAANVEGADRNAVASATKGYPRDRLLQSRSTFSEVPRRYGNSVEETDHGP